MREQMGFGEELSAVVFRADGGGTMRRLTGKAHRDMLRLSGLLGVVGLRQSGLVRDVRSHLLRERDHLLRAAARRWPHADIESLVRVAEGVEDRAFAYGIHPNLIVNAGENFLVDAWQNSVELEIMKYHGCGTGTAAATEGDTTLGAESTTILNPDSTRATGSLGEGASTNIFRTIGTPLFDGAGAITEWGLFSQAATGGGTLWSRVVFSAINVASGDSIQFTYDLTVE